MALNYEHVVALESYEDSVFKSNATVQRQQIIEHQGRNADADYLYPIRGNSPALKSPQVYPLFRFTFVHIVDKYACMLHMCLQLFKKPSPETGFGRNISPLQFSDA